MSIAERIPSRIEKQTEIILSNPITLRAYGSALRARLAKGHDPQGAFMNVLSGLSDRDLVLQEAYAAQQRAELEEHKLLLGMARQKAAENKNDSVEKFRVLAARALAVAAR